MIELWSRTNFNWPNFDFSTNSSFCGRTLITLSVPRNLSWLSLSNGSFFVLCRVFFSCVALDLGSSLAFSWPYSSYPGPSHSTCLDSVVSSNGFCRTCPDLPALSRDFAVSRSLLSELFTLDWDCSLCSRLQRLSCVREANDLDGTVRNFSVYGKDFIRDNFVVSGTFCLRWKRLISFSVSPSLSLVL